MHNSKEILEIINQAIGRISYQRQPGTLYEPIRYVLSLGGKRIRPVLMMLSYNLYHEDVETILPQALAIEIYHNYTLLHDDLMDKADLRRGKPTVHKIWNDNAAILSGDTMLVMAYKSMTNHCSPQKLPQLIDLFTETALQIGEGQQYDMDFETRNDVTEAEYIEMIRLKTSVLLACSLKIGAILADAPAEHADLLYDFGQNLGLAFQLQDDYLDVYGDPAVFGKNTGGDILCNKKTFLLIHAYNRADSGLRAQLDNWISKPYGTFNSKEKIEAVTAIYNRLGIRELCKEKTDYYFDKATELLGRLPLPATRKSSLREMAHDLLARKA